MSQNIVIYRDHLLPYSETFILKQAESLKNFNPHYLGSRRVAGLELPADRTFTVNSGGSLGKVREILFKTSGVHSHLNSVLESIKPRLIHAHFGPDGLLVLPIAGKNGCPLVTTFHGYDVTSKDEFARRSFYSHRRYVAHRAKLQNEGDLFIAVSDFIRTKMLAQDFPEDKTIKHYIGIDLETIKPDLQIKRERLVLFVGRLIANKGTEYLIKAMSQLQTVLDDVELLVIGDGPLRKDLEELARERLRRFRFIGAQPQEVVRYWMNRASVLCGPSITVESGASEGLGQVFLEAAAMGLPAVGFATGGISEAVEHNTTGFLATERDWEKLAKYIYLVLVEKDLWQRFSKEGRKRVERLFDLKEQTKDLEKIYENLLERLER